MPVQSGGIQLDTAILDQLIRNTPEALDRWLPGVAIEVQSDIVLEISALGPSSPGDPPGVDTGNLRAGIGTDKQGPLSYIVYAQAEYAAYLELGTERMGARPFFMPIFEQWNRGKLENSARQAGLLNV